MDYLQKHMDEKFPFSVYVSKSSFFRCSSQTIPSAHGSLKKHACRYWNEKKNTGNYVFEPPTSQRDMPLREFVSKIRARPAPAPTPAEDVSTPLQSLSLSDAPPPAAAACAATAPDEAGGERFYLQQTLVTGMGEQILSDFRTVDWTGVHAWQARARPRRGAGPLLSNGPAARSGPRLRARVPPREWGLARVGGGISFRRQQRGRSARRRPAAPGVS